MTGKQHQLKHALAAAGLLLNLCVGAAHAQSQSDLTGDLSYTHGSGSGGYGSHSLAANVESTALPISFGFNATQGLVNSAEVSTQVGADMGWRVSPLWSLAANLSTTNDDTLNVSARGLSVAFNLDELWQGSLATRIEVGRTLSEYSLRSGPQNLSGKIPEQLRTRLELRQGLSESVDVSVSLETYEYSRDPLVLARALLSRKVRRVAAIGMLGDLPERSQSVGLNWSVAEAWNLDLSTVLSTAVMGQNQRQMVVGVSYMFHPRSSVSLTLSDSRSDALAKANGAIISAAQSDSSVDVGLRWFF